MTTMNIKNELNAKQLESINGGGIFDAHRDSTYHQAGVEIVGPGTFYNDGYKFKGQSISEEEAGILVDYYRYFHHVAESLPHAKEEVRRYAETYLDF